MPEGAEGLSEEGGGALHQRTAGDRAGTRMPGVLKTSYKLLDALAGQVLVMFRL